MTPKYLQRLDELNYAERFLRHHFHTVPVFEDLPPESQPDICALFEGRRIGIQLTKAIDSEAALYDSFAHSVLRVAMLRHEALGGLSGRVIVSLQQGYNPKRKELNSLGAALGELVARHWVDTTEIGIITPRDMTPEVATVFAEGQGL